MTTLTLTPAQAADRLGVSSTALRRASPTYEQHFGPLPREGRGGRLWTAEALERMRLAFEAVHQKQMVSITAALEVLSTGTGFPIAQASEAGGRVDAHLSADLLVELLTEVRAIRAENVELAREVQALRLEVAASRILPASAKAEAGEKLRHAVEGLSRSSESLEGVTLLRVAAVTLPSSLKNTLRWPPSRYTDLEAVLRGTEHIRLDRSSGKPVWRGDDGKRMRRDTVVRLLGAGVLAVTDGSRTAPA